MIETLIRYALAGFTLVIFWCGIGIILLEKHSDFTSSEAMEIGMRYCGCSYDNIEWVISAPMNAYVIECTDHTRITVGKDTTLTRRGEDKCK